MNDIDNFFLFEILANMQSITNKISNRIEVCPKL